MRQSRVSLPRQPVGETPSSTVRLAQAHFTVVTERGAGVVDLVRWMPTTFVRRGVARGSTVSSPRRRSPQAVGHRPTPMRQGDAPAPGLASRRCQHRHPARNGPVSNPTDEQTAAVDVVVVRPLSEQEQLPLQRAGRGVGGGIHADRDLAGGPLAHRSAVLPGHPHRRSAALGKRHIVDHSHLRSVSA